MEGISIKRNWDSVPRPGGGSNLVPNESEESYLRGSHVRLKFRFNEQA